MCKGIPIRLHIAILLSQYIKIILSVILIAIDDDTEDVMILPPGSSKDRLSGGGIGSGRIDNITSSPSLLGCR